MAAPAPGSEGDLESHLAQGATARTGAEGLITVLVLGWTCIVIVIIINCCCYYYYLDYACQGDGGHSLGGQLGHILHVRGQTIGHAGCLSLCLHLALLWLKVLLWRLRLLEQVLHCWEGCTGDVVLGNWDILRLIGNGLTKTDL